MCASSVDSPTRWKVTAQGVQALQTEVESLAGMLMQHKLALDYLLSKKGDLCFWLNTACCHYINQSGLTETNIVKLHQIAADIRKTYTHTHTY